MSGDGVDWRRIAESSPVAVGGHLIYHDRYLWHIGGDSGNDEYTNEVWTSHDGRAWNRIEQHEDNPLVPIANHRAVSFDGKLYVIGGHVADGNSGVALSPFVWSSADGKVWTNHANLSAAHRRAGHEAILHRGTVWLVGGDGNRLVGHSADFSNWGTATPEGPEVSGASGLVLNNRLLLIGDRAPERVTTDIDYTYYASADASRWTANETPWSARRGVAAAAFGDAIYALGGRFYLTIPDADGMLNFAGATNDVWKSSDAENWSLIAQGAFPARHDVHLVGIGELPMAETGHLYYVGPTVSSPIVQGVVNTVLVTVGVEGGLRPYRYTVFSPQGQVSIDADNRLHLSGNITVTRSGWLLVTVVVTDATPDNRVETIIYVPINPSAGYAFSASINQWLTEVASGVNQAVASITVKDAGGGVYYQILNNTPFSIDSHNHVWVQSPKLPPFTPLTLIVEVGERRNYQAPVTLSMTLQVTDASFNNKLLLLGGKNENDEPVYRDIWSYGGEWNNLGKALPLTTDFTAVFYQNALWLLDGAGREVWRLHDNTVWKQVTLQQAFAAVENARAVVHRNTLLLIGNDNNAVNIWASSNGSHWTLRAQTIVNGTSSLQVFAYNDVLYLLAGDAEGAHRLWTSNNGEVWDLHPADIPLTDYSAALYNGALHLVSGGSAYWRLPTGALSWQQLDNLPFSPRSGAALRAHNDVLHLFGGKSASDTIVDEHWLSANGFQWQRVTVATPPARHDAVLLSAQDNINGVAGWITLSLPAQVTVVAGTVDLTLATVQVQGGFGAPLAISAETSDAALPLFIENGNELRLSGVVSFGNSGVYTATIFARDTGIPGNYNAQPILIFVNPQPGVSMSVGVVQWVDNIPVNTEYAVASIIVTGAVGEVIYDVAVGSNYFSVENNGIVRIQSPAYVTVLTAYIQVREARGAQAQFIGLAVAVGKAPSETDKLPLQLNVPAVLTVVGTDYQNRVIATLQASGGYGDYRYSIVSSESALYVNDDELIAETTIPLGLVRMDIIVYDESVNRDTKEVLLVSLEEADILWADLERWRTMVAVSNEPIPVGRLNYGGGVGAITIDAYPSESYANNNFRLNDENGEIALYPPYSTGTADIVWVIAEERGGQSVQVSMVVTVVSEFPGGIDPDALRVQTPTDWSVIQGDYRVDLDSPDGPYVSKFGLEYHTFSELEVNGGYGDYRYEIINHNDPYAVFYFSGDELRMIGAIYDPNVDEHYELTIVVTDSTPHNRVTVKAPIQINYLQGNYIPARHTVFV